ncbi:HxlR family transcriptional regulator [Ancylomarina subtilis]|uniref:HxlR family transcriptional regulator n=1 Tax=Ancylomarina subtilis TaxID=1639035 RepID=A0A4Q7V9F9_9BACT|nr:helix-turn-helix domain-containing protein [Ancylomarina subtilis]RZT91312.1 HxlR family transcriptional regulator [Ancylomarina subtilis]
MKAKLKYFIEVKGEYYNCPIELTLSMISGKWKGIILWHLIGNDTLRFNELEKAIPSISQRMLTKELREMEKHGFIYRKVYPQVPPKVEYSLSDLGRSVIPIIKSLSEWGSNYAQNCGKIYIKE